MSSSNSGKYEFLDAPDAELKCVGCAKVAAEPWQHSKCGSLLCKKCLEAHGRERPCPGCKGQETTPIYFEDIRSESSIIEPHPFLIND